MAKRCIKIALNGSLFNSGEISDFSALTNAEGVTNLYENANLPNWVTSLGNVFFDQAVSSTLTSETGTQYKNNYTDWDHYNSHEYYFKADGYADDYRRTIYTANWCRSYLVFVVDDDIQEGWILEISYINMAVYVIQQIHITNLYYYIGGEYVPYHWSSVPAISGKNGILLPMSTLNDINDGDEVTTPDTSKFNLNDSSNIKNLVDAVVNDF